MKSTLRTTVVLLLYLPLFFVPLSSVAQAFPSLYFSESFASPGESLRIDLLADNFQNISTVQFAIRWDTTVLQLQAIKDLGFEPSPLLPSNFNEDLFSEGKLIFIELNENGLNIENGSALFGMDFRVVGLAGDSTILTFDNNVAIAEITQRLNDTTDLNITDSVGFNNQTVRVSTVNNLESSNLSSFNLRATPNPFPATTTISWEQQRAGEVNWTLINSLGQVMNRGSYVAPTGTQYIPVEMTNSLPAGSYYFNLQTDKKTITLKLLYVKP